MTAFSRIPLLVALGAVCLATAWAYDPHSLAIELRRIDAEVAAGNKSQIAASLPESWTVESPQGQYPISTRPLRRLIGASGNDGKARAWLEELAEQLEGFSGAAVVPGAAARRRLDQILARKEFSGIHPPTPWEIFRDRMYRAIIDFLKWFFSLASGHPMGALILGWTAGAAAIGFLLYLVLKPLMKAESMTPSHETDPTVRNWEEWARAAQSAARNGNLREAIHCAYWCAVARLQEAGSLPSDGARTPREYVAAAKERIAPLISLTATLERVWYAGRAASEQDVQESFRYLEALGCRLD